MAKKNKYYVVWQGNAPGIYDSWAECEKQIKGVAGAKYKSYESRTLAEQAFRIGPELAASVVERQTKGESMLTVDDQGMTAIRPDVAGPKPELDAIAVDAACSGNPGVMEYQGVYVAYLKKNKMSQILYSDSVNAINWVRAKQCRTKLPLTPDTEKLYDIIHRAEAWLHNNRYSTEIRKWDTDHWGEIPADFGRK